MNKMDDDAKKIFVPKKDCGTHIYYIIMYSYIYNKVRRMNLTKNERKNLVIFCGFRIQES